MSQRKLILKTFCKKWSLGGGWGAQRKLKMFENYCRADNR